MNYIKEILCEYEKSVNSHSNYLLFKIFNDIDKKDLKKELISNLEKDLIKSNIVSDFINLYNAIEKFDDFNVKITMIEHKHKNGNIFFDLEITYGYANIILSCANNYYEETEVFLDSFKLDKLKFHNNLNDYKIIINSNENILKDNYMISTLQNFGNKIINKKKIFSEILNQLDLFLESNSENILNFSSLYKTQEVNVITLLKNLKEDCDILLLNDIKVFHYDKLEKLYNKIIKKQEKIKRKI